MKIIRIILCIFLFFSIIPSHTYALNSALDWQNEQQIRISSALTGSDRQTLDNIMTTSDDVWDISSKLDTILKSIDYSPFLISSLKSLFKMLMVALIAGICNGLYKSDFSESLPVVTITSALAMTTVLFSDLQGMLALCTQTLEHTSVFSTAILPVMAGAITLSGAPITASATQSITMIALNFIIRFISGVLIPAICAYIAIITVNAALENDILENLGQFVRWLTTGSLKLILTIFIAYLSISGAISGNVDALALKTAKFAVSGSVPVVGGIISDATESMLAGMITVKNALGLFGMLGVLIICLAPFLQVGLNYIIFKAGAAAFSPICTPPLRKLMIGIGDSFGLMLGMLGTCSSMLFFQLVFSVMMVNPL